MTAETNPMRNVGTPESPVSWLHERTVAALYDGLMFDRTVVGQRNPGAGKERKSDERKRSMRVRLNPGGELSHDLCEGVLSVKIPDPEWDIIGGIIPDLVLYGEDTSKPIRIIEVIVSSPPDAAKTEKLDKLQKRGVDVVEITVKSEEDLQNLMDVSWIPVFWAYADRSPKRGSSGADKFVRQIIDALEFCSPEFRVALKQTLDELESVESVHPLSPENPLRDKLCR